MSEKQSFLDAVSGIPESASWSEITDALIGVVARRGSAADFARLYRAQLTADQLAEYLDPKPEFELPAVLAELQQRHAKRTSA